MTLTPHEWNEIALCLRIGAAQAERDAAQADALPVKEAHQGAAQFRAELAKKIKEMAR